MDDKILELLRQLEERVIILELKLQALENQKSSVTVGDNVIFTAGTTLNGIDLIEG